MDGKSVWFVDEIGTQQEMVRQIVAGQVEGTPRAERQMDPHLSHIFLSGDRAWKLKRAVQMPFVDFATIEQRKAACRAEIDINRKFGSDFYVDMVAVTRTGGRF